MAKILLIVAALFLLASAGLGYVNRNKLTDKQAEVISTKATADSARNDAIKAKAAQKEADAARALAVKDATDSKANLDKATAEVTTLQGQMKTASDDVAAKQKEIEALKIAAAAATPPPAMTPPPGMADELAKAKLQLAELQLVKDGLDTKLKSAQEGQQAAERRIALRETAEAKAGLQGRVLAVDRNWNFVVLNLGGRSGVNANEMMVIRRGTSLVGRVRVTSVEPTQCIADIVPNSVPAGVSVQAGDTVVYAGGS